jgi:hypothetical protein
VSTAPTAIQRKVHVNLRYLTENYWVLFGREEKPPFAWLLSNELIYGSRREHELQLRYGEKVQVNLRHLVVLVSLPRTPCERKSEYHGISVVPHARSPIELRSRPPCAKESLNITGFQSYHTHTPD